jgi:hypothetical protein
MPLFSLLAALLLLLSPADPPGSPAPDERAAVLAVVERLFDGMRARDGAMVASVFHPEARMVRTSVGPSGEPVVRVTGVEAFVAAVGRGGEPWNEPIFRTEVRLEDNLALVWTHFRFYAGDTFSHCGHNAFLLVRDALEGGAPAWRIIDLADTRRTEGCEPQP